MTDDPNPYRSPTTGRNELLPNSDSDKGEAPTPLGVGPADLVQLTSYAHVAEAHLCQSVLREHGIESSLENEAAIGVNLLWSNAVGGVKVFVMSSDLDRATQLLVEARDAVQAKSSQGPVTFHCEECNAEITFPGNRRGHVETCPKCHEYVDVPE